MATKSNALKKRAFLAAVAEVGNITEAAKVAGVNRKDHYRWLQKDPSYPELFEAAMQEAADLMEAEARRRAVEGVDEPVFYQGYECGSVRKYSDTLLMFLLKGVRPEKFRENVKQEISGPNGTPVNVIFNIPRPPKDGDTPCPIS